MRALTCVVCDSDLSLRKTMHACACVSLTCMLASRCARLSTCACASSLMRCVCSALMLWCASCLGADISRVRTEAVSCFTAAQRVRCVRCVHTDDRRSDFSPTCSPCSSTRTQTAPRSVTTRHANRRRRRRRRRRRHLRYPSRRTRLVKTKTETR
jgi:hypothetical protein